ncbi:MAG TPA: IS4 family transposase [Draconibacterium sp.]|nr:IS4 family transposase [Draconibacterium sp.]
MLTFEKIIEPVIPFIKEEQNRLKNDEKLYKLSLYYFMVNLIYAVLNKTSSIRLLITEIKTNPDLKKLGFILASPSMYSEAFSRYKPEVFQRIFAKLIETIEIKDIPEIRTLGRFILFDGSLFPAFRNMEWAQYTSKCHALKLHLAYELNRMIPVQFISSEANYSERKVLMELLESGVTYIMDRGYLAFDIFQKITEKQAFFITRIRYNIRASIQTALAVDIPESWNVYLSEVTDTLVVFSGDKSKVTYRLVCFYVLGEGYRITTNRLDLKTSEIIIFYAYRWQVELFFRCIKRTLDALHLWNHEPNGVKIQFYIYLIVYVLLIHFKQTLVKEKESQKEAQRVLKDSSSKKEDHLRKTGSSRLPVEYSLVSFLGSKLKKLWKISIHWLTCIKNLLLHPMTDEHRDIIFSTQ